MAKSKSKTIINDLSPKSESLPERPIFRTAYNYKYHPGRKETNDMASETILGQSLSVRELLINYTRGILPPVGKQPYYSGATDFDDFDPTLSPDFDLSDATNMIEEIKSRQAERRNTTQTADETQHPDKSNVTKEHSEKQGVESPTSVPQEA